MRGAAVTLAADERVTDVVLRAGRHGTIAGTVRDDAGDPVVSISVRTFNRRVAGFRPMLFPRGSAVTDDRGQFRIGDLPAGDYLVCACAKDPLPVDKDLLTRMASFTVPAASVVHPGSTRVSGAWPVSVGHGDDRIGITITMLAVTPRRVSGQVVGGGPNTDTVYSVVLFPEDEDPAAIGISEMAPAHVTPDGTFNFVGVTPGRYTLEVFPANGTKGLRTSVAIVVGDEDVTHLAVPLGEEPTVRGRVEFAGAGPRPDADTLEKSSAGLIPMHLTPGVLISLGGSGTLGYGAKLARDGSFSIAGVPPGRYRFTSTGLGAGDTSGDLRARQARVVQ